MSAEYKEFLKEKQLLEEKRQAIAQELTNCEKEIEVLRKQYSKNCEHPTRILNFPVCGLCFDYVSAPSKE